MTRRAASLLLPVLILVVLAVLVVVVLLVGRDPDVRSVNPGIVQAGDRIEITGRFFGSLPATVILGGRTIPSRSVQTWNDDLIEFTVPEGSRSGLLYVETEQGRSRGFLLRLRGDIPRAIGGADAPRIDSIESREPLVGDLLVIRGRGFGLTRRSARVRFPLPYAPECAVCGEEYLYASWSDEEIRVRVPDGVIPGFLVVETPWGESNPVRIEPSFPSGRVIVSDRYEIGITYGVDVSAVVLSESLDTPSAGDYSLTVRLPELIRSPAQRDVRYITDPRSLVHIEEVDESYGTSVRQTAVVHRYGMRSEIDPTRISGFYEDSTSFFAYFTRPVPGLDLDNQDVRALADQARRGRASPYAIARAAYDLVRASLVPAVPLDRMMAGEALASGHGDNYSYASLYVSVLRAALIPSRIVSGVVTDGERFYPHFWSEFFVTGVGWVPVDPAFGDGAFPAGFPEPDSPADFYFGNLDALRLAFSRGIDDGRVPTSVSVSLEPRNPVSLQRVYAQAGAGVESFVADWPVPAFLGARREG